jgi:salicylate synthase
MKGPHQLHYHELRISGHFEPLELVTRLVDAGLFREYVVYEREGVWSLAGDALAEIKLDAAHITTRFGTDAAITGPWGSNPLERVRDALHRIPLREWNAYGWLSFEYAYLAAGLAAGVGAQPLLHLIVPETEVRLAADHVIMRSTQLAMVDRVRTHVMQPATRASYEIIPVNVHDGARRYYEEIVETAVGEIHRGLYQKVILSRSVPVPGPVDFAGTYLLGRAANHPARSFVLDLGGRKAVGFSPETVAEVSETGRVSTQPLAGSRAFGLGEDADRRLEAELLSDPKEIFEHAISVKLAYDELRTLCAPGSVAVVDLMSVKQRGSVQHIGSRVTGQLVAGRSAWDALDLLFPAVTASGIPKSLAYNCIVRLEERPRDLYAGAVLMASNTGALDAALVLRTLFEQNGQAWLRAGAGIVAQSLPAREYEETCEKLRSIAPYIVRARSAALDMAEASGAA